MTYSLRWKNNQNTGGVTLKGTPPFCITSEACWQSLEDILCIAIKETESGTPLFVKDVAEVRGAVPSATGDDLQRGRRGCRAVVDDAYSSQQQQQVIKT